MESCNEVEANDLDFEEPMLIIEPGCLAVSGSSSLFPWCHGPRTQGDKYQ